MSSYLNEGLSAQKNRSDMIRRKDKRTNVKGFVGDIADGNFVFVGDIEDISSSGVKISHLPTDFSFIKSSYRTIISGGGRHYRVVVRPCWIRKDENTSTMEAGFKIIDAPWDWEEFVLNSDSLTGLIATREYQA